MKLKTMLHKIPGFRWLDEFTDTKAGKAVTAVLVFVAAVMWYYCQFKL